MYLIRERLPIPSTSPAEGVMKGYDEGLERDPMLVSKVVEGGFQSSSIVLQVRF